MHTDNMTLAERERFHFANGDINSAWLIRDAEEFTIDSVEYDHEKALKAAENDGYEMGVKDTTPDAMREKLEALEIELIETKRLYKIARENISSSAACIRAGLCKTSKGRDSLVADMSQVLRYLPASH